MSVIKFELGYETNVNYFTWRILTVKDNLFSRPSLSDLKSFNILFHLLKSVSLIVSIIVLYLFFYLVMT